jgi:hypothetical protein
MFEASAGEPGRRTNRNKGWPHVDLYPHAGGLQRDLGIRQFSLFLENFLNLGAF